MDQLESELSRESRRARPFFCTLVAAQAANAAATREPTKKNRKKTRARTRRRADDSKGDDGGRGPSARECFLNLTVHADLEAFLAQRLVAQGNRPAAARARRALMAVGPPEYAAPYWSFR